MLSKVLQAKIKTKQFDTKGVRKLCICHKNDKFIKQSEARKKTEQVFGAKMANVRKFL